MGPLAPLNADANSSTLLFLPLAHSFARIIEVGTMEAASCWALLGHERPATGPGVLPADVHPAVPRVFEKSSTARAEGRQRGQGAIFARAARWPSPGAARWTPRRDGPWLRAQHVVFDRLVYGKLRAALGGKARCAISGGAALSERLGHFFRGVGVTVLEGTG